MYERDFNDPQFDMEKSNPIQQPFPLPRDPEVGYLHLLTWKLSGETHLRERGVVGDVGEAETAGDRVDVGLDQEYSVSPMRGHAGLPSRRLRGAFVGCSTAS